MLNSGRLGQFSDIEQRGAGMKNKNSVNKSSAPKMPLWDNTVSGETVDLLSDLEPSQKDARKRKNNSALKSWTKTPLTGWTYTEQKQKHKEPTSRQSELVTHYLPFTSTIYICNYSEKSNYVDINCFRWSLDWCMNGKGGWRVTAATCRSTRPL